MKNWTCNKNVIFADVPLPLFKNRLVSFLFSFLAKKLSSQYQFNRHTSENITNFRSEMELDPQLVDPICEGSIVQVDFQHLADLLKNTCFCIWYVSDRTLHSLHKSSNVFCQVSDSSRVVCENIVHASVNFSFQRLLFPFQGKPESGPQSLRGRTLGL